ncbi:MAG TPA: hypothetical protein VGK96_05555 [Candidatus Sulfotelmatobacter sp.]
MRVMFTDTPGIVVEGTLKAIISEQDAHYPHIVIEMSVTGRDPAKVTLDELDLYTIVRLAKGSTVRKIQDSVRWP